MDELGVTRGMAAEARSHKKKPKRGSVPGGRETGSRRKRSVRRSEPLEAHRGSIIFAPQSNFLITSWPYMIYELWEAC